MSERRRIGFGLALSIFVLLVGVLIGVWIAAGRVLFDAGGDLVTVFLFSMLPVFVIIQLIISVQLVRTTLNGYIIHARTMIFQLLTWLSGIAFGFTVPDTVRGEVVSAFSNLMTTEADRKLALEFAIGFSNPLGILAIGLGVVTAVLAWVDARGRRLPNRNPYRNLS